MGRGTVAGERFVSYLVTGTGTPTNPQPVGMRSGMTFTGTDAVREVARERGLDDDDKVGQFVEATVLALTDQRVVYGSRSSFRNRPKDLLHAAPASGFTLHWIDDDRGAAIDSDTCWSTSTTAPGGRSASG